MYRDFATFIMRDDVFMWISVSGLIVFLLTHLDIIFSAVHSFRNSNSLTSMEIILIIFGILSFVMLLVYFITMNEIEDNIIDGYPFKGLIRLEWSAHFIIISFFLYALFYFIHLSRLGQDYRSTKSVPRAVLWMMFYLFLILLSFSCFSIYNYRRN